MSPATHSPPSPSYPDASSTPPSSSAVASPWSHSSPRSLLLPQPSSTSSLVLSSLCDSNDLHFGGLLVLIVLDATWEHAKEMVRASEDCLRKVSAVRVCLDGDYREDVEGGSMYDGEETLVMRKEPREGYVSTMEAMNRALGAVEDGGGPEIEEKLIGVLREMVGLQKGFLKPTKPRARMVKKKKRLVDNSPSPAD